MAQDIAVSFSTEANDKFTAAKHDKFFVAHGPFENTRSFITKKAWSPIVWKDGRRAKANFESSSVIALDFDSGEWSLQDAIDFAIHAKVPAILATTRSHQREKISGSKTLLPCDRFRLILAAETTTSRDDFEYTMRNYVESLPCDKSCTDAARFYFPCSEIYWSQYEGKPASWLKCPYEETAESQEQIYGAIDPEDMRNLFTLAPHIWTLISKGAANERHKAAYVVSCELSKRGFSEDEILALLVKHKSPLLNIGVGKDDVRRCIWNAAKRVREHGGDGRSAKATPIKAQR